MDDFNPLWERRVTIRDDDGTVIELLSSPDLVFAKKTQRGKDWPVIERLVEADYLTGRLTPNPAQPRFWLFEMSQQRDQKFSGGFSLCQAVLCS